MASETDALDLLFPEVVALCRRVMRMEKALHDIGEELNTGKDPMVIAQIVMQGLEDDDGK
jgi:hypothetical protein